MVALTTPTVQKGWKAEDFDLLATDGKLYSLKSVKGQNGLVVMFICNHCPYVRAISTKLTEQMKLLQEEGVGVVAINANDEEQYQEDSYENMRIFVEENGLSFPYLHDNTQEVAKAYDAVCTPDFFGFNSDLELVYRGRLDDSGMNHKPNAKNELLDAMLEVARTGDYNGPQNSSIGCSIKWK